MHSMHSMHRMHDSEYVESATNIFHRRLLSSKLQGRWSCKCQVAAHGYSQPSFIAGKLNHSKVDDESISRTPATMCLKALFFAFRKLYQVLWRSVRSYVSWDKFVQYFQEGWRNKCNERFHKLINKKEALISTLQVYSLQIVQDK